MTGDSEEEFRAKIELYVAHIKSLVNKEVSILTNGLISSIKDGEPLKSNKNGQSESDITINHLIVEFFNNE